MATIRIEGPQAKLRDTIRPPAGYLRDCLRFQHPARFFNQAFKDKRWDGYVSMFNGAKFPSGFANRVRRHLEEQGVDVRVVAHRGAPVDPSRLSESYLHGITLWPHQLEAIHAILKNSRGILKEPTGSGKTAIMAAAARYFFEEKGWRSLVIVPKKGLARQTADAFRRFYDDDVEVGVVGDGLREEGPVTIATAQTMVHFADRKQNVRGARRPKEIPGDPWLIDLLASIDVVFFDECHRTSSTSWQKIAEACPASRRYGLSGTPLTDEELDDLRLEGATGELIHETDATDLIEVGLSARPKIAMVMSDNASGPALPRVPNALGVMVPCDYRTAYKMGVVSNDAHNKAVVRAARWMIERGRKVLVLCRLKEHFIRLAEIMQDEGLRFAALWGQSDTDERVEAKNDFARGDIDCILATTIFDEGEDISGVGGVVMAEGVQAITTNLQRIGRAMRKDTEDAWIVDFVPMCHRTLMEHALRRCVDYENAGYEVRVIEEWSARRFSGRLPDELLPFEVWDSEAVGT